MSPEPNALTLEERCVDTIRFLAVDGVEKAKSGHPACRWAPRPSPTRCSRDTCATIRPIPPGPTVTASCCRPVTARMLLYSLLHLTGYDLSLDDLRAFRQWGSKTPGHPEYGHTPGVETTTGPWARASPTRSAWRSLSVSSPPPSTATAPLSSITSPTRWPATAHDGGHLAARPPRLPAI